MNIKYLYFYMGVDVIDIFFSNGFFWLLFWVHLRSYACFRIDIVFVFGFIGCYFFYANIDSNVDRGVFWTHLTFLLFACLTCVVVVLLIIKIIVKLFDETIRSKKNNVISKFLGGVSMAFLFTIFYAVLVSFLGKAGVVKLIFNHDFTLEKTTSSVELFVPSQMNVHSDTIQLKNNTHALTYNFLGALRFGTNYRDNSKKIVLTTLDTTIVLQTKQQYRFSALGQQLQLAQSDTEQMLCFCNSDYLLSIQEERLVFESLINK